MHLRCVTELPQVTVGTIRKTALKDWGRAEDVQTTSAAVCTCFTCWSSCGVFIMKPRHHLAPLASLVTADGRVFSLLLLTSSHRSAADGIRWLTIRSSPDLNASIFSKSSTVVITLGGTLMRNLCFVQGGWPHRTSERVFRDKKFGQNAPLHGRFRVGAVTNLYPVLFSKVHGC